MTHTITFNSSDTPAETLLSLAAGYISLTQITFVNEHITVHIEAKTGEVAFFNDAAHLLLSAKMPVPSSGDEKFSEVSCNVQGDMIRLGFPTYAYKDNYPHCDGESDRWTKTISGFRYLCYNIKSNCIVE